MCCLWYICVLLKTSDLVSKESICMWLCQPNPSSYDCAFSQKGQYFRAFSVASRYTDNRYKDQGFLLCVSVILQSKYIFKIDKKKVLPTDSAMFVSTYGGLYFLGTAHATVSTPLHRISSPWSTIRFFNDIWFTQPVKSPVGLSSLPGITNTSPGKKKQRRPEGGNALCVC